MFINFTFAHLFRNFKEAGLCLKNFAFRCMDDESRIKTGLILSGISLVGSSFCASQKEKEGNIIVLFLECNIIRS